MSVSGWGVWSQWECRLARRAGGTPVHEPGGAPATPRSPLAHASQEPEVVCERAAGRRRSGAEGTQGTSGSPQAIHALQTPR